MKSEVRRIYGFSKHYDWGDVAAIHDLRGSTPDGEPLAEVWFGTHRGGPSQLEDGTLLESVVTKPTPQGRIDGLPYLVKLIAPAKPLSIQVHPSIEQAQAGFALENEKGIALNVSERTFQDPNHKPELLLALTPWRALLGFAPIGHLVAFNEAVGTPLAGQIAHQLRSTGLVEALRHTLEADLKPATEEVAAYVDRCAKLVDYDDPHIAQRANMIVHVNEFFPLRSSLLGAALMNIVELQPGEAFYVPVGTTHAYVSGLGLEVMASSANTIRAGLTSKHIDVDLLLRTANITSRTPDFVLPKVTPVSGSSLRTYLPESVEDFRLDVLDLLDPCVRGRASADTIAVNIGGSACINGQELACGHAMWIPEGVEVTLTPGTRKSVTDAQDSKPSVAFVSVSDSPVAWEGLV